MLGLFEKKQNWWQATAEKNKFTPDINKIESRESWWLFCCEEMQINLPKFDLVSPHSRTYGEAFTEDKFTLWKRPLGKETTVVAMDSHPSLKPVPMAMIRGKLVNISSPQLVKLDQYRENTVQSLRRRVWVNYPYHEVCEVRDPTNYTRIEGVVKAGVSQVMIPHVQPVRAWMYVGTPEYWLEQIKISPIKTNGKVSSLLISNHERGMIETVKRFQPNNPLKPDYYYFSKLEYNG